MSQQERDDPQFGGDSFLDVVANVVGILIILIVVVSMRIARNPEIHAEPAAAAAIPSETPRPDPHSPDPHSPDPHSPELNLPEPDSESSGSAFRDPDSPETDSPGPKSPVSASQNQDAQGQATPSEASRVLEESVRDTAAKPAESAPQEESRPPERAVSPDFVRQIGLLQQEVDRLEGARDDARRQVVRLLIEGHIRGLERSQTAVEVSRREQELAQRKAQLDADQRKEFELFEQVSRLEAEVTQLDEQLIRIQSVPSEVVEIRHDPTSLSRTVYGDELHCRIAEGRLAVIPLDELLSQLEQDLLQQARQSWKFRGGKPLRSQVGPVDGFRMTYQAVVDRLSSTVRVTRWSAIPDDYLLSETVEEALGPRSRFREALKRTNPRRTTVTFWIYPDSFAAFRILRQRMATMGYGVAGRPLPEGRLISGSPNGSRSAAQ